MDQIVFCLWSWYLLVPSTLETVFWTKIDNLGGLHIFCTIFVYESWTFFVTKYVIDNLDGLLWFSSNEQFQSKRTKHHYGTYTIIWQYICLIYIGIATLSIQVASDHHNCHHNTTLVASFPLDIYQNYKPSSTENLTLLSWNSRKSDSIPL